MLWILLLTAAAWSGEWYKGNTHAHTLWSDGDSLPEVVAAWYRDRGYQFLVLSDHNTLSRGTRWVPVVDHAATVAAGEARFGDQAAPQRKRVGWKEVQLRPLSEVRALVEEPGGFVLVEGVEITDTVSGAPVHVNALNVDEALRPAAGSSAGAALRGDVRKIRRHEDELGRPVFAHANHPLWMEAISARDLAASHIEAVEIINGGGAVNDGTEQLWDEANALRLRSGGQPLLAVAADDAHVFAELSPLRECPGRGWIVVRAEALEPDALVTAMKVGDFYASTGVSLDDIRFDDHSRTLSVAATPREGAAYHFDFVGQRGDEAGLRLHSAQGGTEASYTLLEEDRWVRVVVTDADAPMVSWDHTTSLQRAWTQVFGWPQSP